MGRGILHRQKGAFEVNSQCRVPLFLGDLLNWRPDAIDASVGNHQIESSPVVNDAGNGLFHLPSIGYIRRQTDGLAATFGNGCRHLLSAILA